ncbi:MAG: NINE protein [Pseudomonadota bacterium]
MGDRLHRPKSLGVAYGLWLAAGPLGAHRFYLRRYLSGLIYLLLLALCFAALFFYLAAVPLTVLILYLLVDAAVLPRMVRRANAPAPISEG